MADSKISALPASTTPLAGTEVLPIVQSSTTKQVSVANLTAGRAVSAASLALTTSPLPATSGGTGQSSAFTANGVPYATSTSALAVNGNLTFDGNSFQIANSGYAAKTLKLLPNTGDVNYYTTITDNIDSNMTISKVIFGKTTTSLVFYNGDVTNSNGNFIQGTAAKGINFTANTPAAGKTSQLLNWYEEGTWTPDLQFNGANTGITYANRQATYTRIGRQIFIQIGMYLSSKGSATGTATIAGLPFTVSNLAFKAESGLITNTGALTVTGIAYGVANANTTVIGLNAMNNGSSSSLSDTAFANNTYFGLSLTYTV